MRNNQIVITFIVFIVMSLTWGCKSKDEEVEQPFSDLAREITGSETLLDFPVNTFLENLVVDENNNLFFTSYLEGVIYRFTAEGNLLKFAEIEGNISGIAFGKNGGFLVTGTRNNRGFIFHLDRDGQVEDETVLTEASYFLNGIVFYKKNIYLIADSAAGKIWSYNIDTKEYGLWLDHDFLKSPLPEDAQMRIGVNGLKIKDTFLYATNTQQQTIIKVEIGKEGEAGKPEIVFENILGDDFAIADNGDLYVATHPLNCVVKITPSGEKTVIAGAGQGVTGCTAVAFGKTDQTNTLYVVTNGGMFNPPGGEVQKALVVALPVYK